MLIVGIDVTYEFFPNSIQNLTETQIKTDEKNPTGEDEWGDGFWDHVQLDQISQVISSRQADPISSLEQPFCQIKPMNSTIPSISLDLSKNDIVPCDHKCRDKTK